MREKNPLFIYALLFEPVTSSLADPAFYRSIHYILGPLRGPLLDSTSPERGLERVMIEHDHHHHSFNNQLIRNFLPQWKGVFTLCYNSKSVTTQSSIPEIPDPEYHALNSSAAATATTHGELPHSEPTR